MAEVKRLDALVVGAGFSGLYMLIKLRELGLAAQVVEAGSGVGGTWYWNRYPGARCDISSVEYSYSFDPELEQEWTWKERYSAQPDILEYLEHVADRYGLRDGITFNTRVTTARWNEDRARWLVETDKGDSFDAQFLILATGALSEPKLPDLPGLENFSGSILSTARWDDSVDLTGKRVCHFGVGSSGIQTVAEIGKTVGELTVFSRTPSFAVPCSNPPLTAEQSAAAKADYPAMRDLQRHSALSFATLPKEGSAKECEPAEREKRLESAWTESTFSLLLEFDDILFDDESNALVTEFAQRKLAQTITDPEKARKLIPQDVQLGGRRLCAEIGFYDAINRENVTVVDVREEPVVSITTDAVVTDKGSYPADAIIFATGFDACVGAIKAIDIKGKEGRSIRDEWANGPRAYLGLAVEGFPNMFTITGPGSPSVLSNVVVSIEQHVEWIARCLADMRESGATVIEAEPQAEQAWMEHVDEVARQTIFPKANSWYMGHTHNGKRVFMPYVGGVGAYRAKCDEVAAAGYEGFTLGDAA
jgi:cyclohexanone monooxygenase